MAWPPGAQRVLAVLAGALLALGAWSARPGARLPPAVPVADDPALEVRIDLNRATAADLETLPGIGAAIAGRIVAYRSEHGPFRCVEDLEQIPGIGEKLVARLRPLVTVAGTGRSAR